jgi:nitrogen fixation protein NifU and related proteins
MAHEAYSSAAIDHFTQPRNVGQLAAPDAVGVVENPACGDQLELHLQIQAGHIVEARFRTFGCSAAIACGSMLTVMLTGIRLDRASQISKADLVTALGGLPTLKMHASGLAADGLQAALANWGEKRSDAQPDDESPTNPSHRTES